MDKFPWLKVDFKHEEARPGASFSLLAWLKLAAWFMAVAGALKALSVIIGWLM